MKPISRLTATLILPFILAGCELITDQELSGSLTPLSQEQATQFSALVGASNFAPSVDQAQSIGLEVSSDCAGDQREISTGTLIGGATFSIGTGSLEIDDITYNIQEVACESLLDQFEGLNRLGWYIAEPDDPSLPSEVSIFVAEFSSDDTELQSNGLDSFNSQTGLFVLPFSENGSLLTDLENIIVAATFVPDPIIDDDPAPQTAQQTLTQAAVDLHALITDDYSYTNWVLYGALFALEKAADESNWEDDGTLVDAKGQLTFTKVAIAVNEIERVADWTNDGALMVSLDAITTAILDAMRTVATDRIDLAVASGGDEFRIARANYRLEAGDVLRAQDQLRRTAKRYGGAWRAATRAIQ